MLAARWVVVAPCYALGWLVGNAAATARLARAAVLEGYRDGAVL